jgi:predicted phosphodiesterase
MVLVLVAAMLGCAPPRPPRPTSQPALSPGPSAERAPPRGPLAPWTIAVLSDIHIPVDGSVPIKLRQVVAAVIASRPRLVVVTGDFTDGNPRDPTGRLVRAPQWWRGTRQGLEPFRAAGIPVLPAAGNHDSYLLPHRIAYAAAWSDLDRWAAPLAIWGHRQPPQGIALDAAPFSYSVDVDGVHLMITHIVDAALDPAVTRWIAGELAAARGARLRLVFGHVPLSSIVTEPRRAFIAQLGGILTAGHADLYVAGHEHLVWDDDVALAGGASLRQLLVGTASAPWQFGPSAEARRRAQCRDLDARMRCLMPHGGAPFELRRERERWIEPEPYTFTLITIYGRAIIARAFAVDDRGQAVPFGAAAMTPER